MLVLLSFVLVLVATVLLVLGLVVDDGLILIYVSIGTSALAAVLLGIVRLSKSASGDDLVSDAEPGDEGDEAAGAEVDGGAGEPDVPSIGPLPAENAATQKPAAPEP